MGRLLPPVVGCCVILLLATTYLHAPQLTTDFNVTRALYSYAEWRRGNNVVVREEQHYEPAWTHDALQKHDLAVVPVTAYHACNDRVLHLSCELTIQLPVPMPLMDGNTKEIDDGKSLSKLFCMGLDKNAERVTANVCLQTPDMLGVLIHQSPVSKGELQLDTNEARLMLSDAFEESRLIELKTILMTGAYWPDSKASIERRMKIEETNGNYGNMLWQYGATNMINPATTKIFDFKETPSKGSPPTSAVVIATANLINLENKMNQGLMNMLNYFTHFVRDHMLPAVVLGIGSQVEFENMQNESITELAPHQVDFFNTVARTTRRAAIGTRGNMTTLVCKKNGIAACLPLGCPSLSISREFNLGADLELKWQALKESKNKTKLALIPPAIWNNHAKDALLEEYLDFLYTLHDHNDAFFVRQMRYDILNLQKHEDQNKPKKKLLARLSANFEWFWCIGRKKCYSDIALKNIQAEIKTFTTMPDWLEAMKQVDLVVSTRIHGGMAGLSAGIPAVVIPTDMRIMELVHAMRVPYITIDMIREHKINSVAGILEHAQYQDFNAFEKNRREVIQAYKGVLDEAQVEMDPSLNVILQATI